MDQASEEEVVLEKFRRLSPEKKRELLDLLQVLESGGSVRTWLEFDEWAMNLAKKKGFSRLSEADVARIVSDFRSGS
jgi:hypothetical protein